MIEGMINMDLDLFDSLLNDYIKMRGVEKTIHHLKFGITFCLFLVSLFPCEPAHEISRVFIFPELSAGKN
jgi:hypothetical protein